MFVQNIIHRQACIISKYDTQFLLQEHIALGGEKMLSFPAERKASEDTQPHSHQAVKQQQERTVNVSTLPGNFTCYW